jgi:hypothetical protein
MYRKIHTYDYAYTYLFLIVVLNFMLPPYRPSFTYVACTIYEGVLISP